MDEQNNTTTSPETSAEPEKKDSAQSEKTFTQAEVDEIVNSRLAREKDKIKSSLRDEVEKDVRTKLETERSEAEKLKNMDTKKRHQYEIDKKDNEIAELKSKLNRSELEHTATDLLGERGIVADSETLNFVVGKDAETTQANIEKFADLINKKAKADRKKEFDNPEPKGGNNSGNSITEKEFQKMDYYEKLKLKEEQPAIYKEMVARTLGGK